NYYGTVQMGGDHNSGYVFKLTPSTGTVSKLHSFADISVASTPHYSNGDGAQPMSTLVEGHDGFLYGTTFYVGSNGTGVIFQMKKTGSDYLVLYEFPAAGTTSTLSGCFPHAGLIQGTDGVFYGTTTLGGTDGSSTLLN